MSRVYVCDGPGCLERGDSDNVLPDTWWTLTYAKDGSAWHFHNRACFTAYAAHPELRLPLADQLCTCCGNAPAIGGTRICQACWGGRCQFQGKCRYGPGVPV